MKIDLPKESGIYCFENIINNKKYIGQSQNVLERVKNHLRKLKIGKDSCRVFQNAWNKYGEDGFIVYIVEMCDLEILDDREIYWIKLLNSHVSNNGYNTSWGGESPMRGRKHAMESRDKMSQSRIGKYSGENGSFYGKKHTIESLILMSENRPDFSGEKNPMFGKKHSEESKKKMSEMRPSFSGENHPLYGTHMSEESKKKSSESNRGQKRTDEVKNKMSEDRIGKKRGKNTTSKYVGVCFDKHANNWMSYFRYNRKTILLGRFSSEIEAATAYNNAVLEYYGENAKLNIIEEEENE